ncbi:MAG: 4-vinyl reductase [Candidatus Bathyarchaeia archaeon]|nr:4-vinyl reductase [Candidatus Bathyarchaeota archaeon]
MDEGKVETGNEVFDHVSALREGCSLLILDSTLFGALIFSNVLFRKADRPVVILSSEPLDSPLAVHRLDLGKLSDMTSLSVEVERVRKSMRERAIIIHAYLPQVLVREEEDRVLKMVQHWQERVQSSRILDVYLLPKGSFPYFEKKMEALAGGSLEIKRDHRTPTFTLLGKCKPDYHLVDFPFIISGDRLLIKWGDEFTDILPKETPEEIKERRDYILGNIPSLRIRRSGVEPTRLTVADRWLFSQLSDMHLQDVAVLFPERLHEVAEKLALWSLRGYIRLEKEAAEKTPVLNERLTLKSRIGLAVPTTLALSLLTEAPRTIPIDVYHALRRSVAAFAREAPASMVELDRSLEELERSFQDFAARVTAVKKLIRNKESPDLKFDLKYLPKLLSITLFYGYRLKPKFRRVNEDVYEMTVPDCFICQGIKSAHPVCHILEGTVTGACGVLLKEKFECREVQCKALGGEACTFRIERKR